MISGYTITLNCIDMNLPFVEAITGVAKFAEQVVVVDWGSTDGTWAELNELKTKLPNLELYQEQWDYNKPDMMGIAKTLARRRCKGDWCYQFDVDEVPHEKDIDKYETLIAENPRVGIFTFPIISFYGGFNALNFRPSSYKWTLVRNEPWVEHGVVGFARQKKPDGTMYFHRDLSDSCEYIDGRDLRHANAKLIERVLIPNELQAIREACKTGQDNPDNLNALGCMWDDVIDGEICLYHYSWIDFRRKAKQHADFWDKMPRYEGGLTPREKCLIDETVKKGEATEETIQKYVQQREKDTFVPLAMSILDHPKVMHNWLEYNDIPAR